MSNWQLKTPVVLILFKRPNTTKRVFEEIRKAKPPKLLAIADGPRPDREGEKEACAAARSIIDGVDWDCEVLKNYSETNLGCGRRVSSGLNWVFNTVKEAIILEDDCVPHPTFFRFCEEMLERYRNDERISTISGQNVQFGRRRTEYSYYFSRYTKCWGWATWKRAWQNYDFDMKLWPEVRDKKLLQYVFNEPKAVKIWTNVFQSMYDQKIDTWDYQWTFASFISNRLTIISDVNLSSNIGYGSEGSTHTTEATSPYNSLAVEPMIFPLKHPPCMIRNVAADEFTQNTLFDYDPNLFKRIKRKLRKISLKKLH